MSYHGDYALGSTFNFKFTTIDSTGLASALTSGALSAYPGNSVTQLTAGLTLSASFDSITGLNNVNVVASSGNGYATATDYAVILSAGTVDSVSVAGYVVGHFSIENRSSLRPTTAGRTIDVSAGGEAGVDWANVGSPTTVLNLSGTTIKTATDVETDTTAILEDTGTTLQAELDAIQAAVITNAAGTDIAADIIALKAVADAVLVDTGTTLQAELDGIQADTEDLQTQIGTAGAGLTAVPWNASWDAEVQSEVADALDAAIPVTPTADSINERIKTMDDADLPGDVAAVKSDTAAILTDTAEIGAAGAGLTEAGGTGDQLTALATAANLATVDTVVDSILADTGTDGVVVAAASKTGYALSATGSAALTEGYAAAGAAPTIVELLYELRALLAEKSISSTTLTTKKLDGATTAATYTLDDATNPSSITRAT